MRNVGLIFGLLWLGFGLTVAAHPFAPNFAEEIVTDHEKWHIGAQGNHHGPDHAMMGHAMMGHGYDGNSHEHETQATLADHSRFGPFAQPDHIGPVVTFLFGHLPDELKRPPRMISA